MKIIESLDNQTIKDVVKLFDKPRFRQESGLFAVDGLREISFALASSWQVEKIFYCPEIADKLPDNLSFFSDRLIECRENVFRKMSYKDNPDGFLAVFKTRKEDFSQANLGALPVLVLESIEKPGNVGAVLRTAYAAGIKTILLCGQGADLYNPNVIRASEGYIFGLSIFSASNEDVYQRLREEKFKILAAATSGDKEYYKADLKGAVAIVLGSEADGLSDFWLEKADELLRIPMIAGVDSLNISVSAAIMIYEARRQSGAF